MTDQKGPAGPLIQIVAMTAYIVVLAALIYALHRFELDTDTIGSVAALAAAAAILFTVWRVGAFSWAMATAIIWVGASVAVMFAFG